MAKKLLNLFDRHALIDSLCCNGASELMGVDSFDAGRFAKVS